MFIQDTPGIKPCLQRNVDKDNSWTGKESWWIQDVLLTSRTSLVQFINAQRKRIMYRTCNKIY